MTCHRQRGELLLHIHTLALDSRTVNYIRTGDPRDSGASCGESPELTHCHDKAILPGADEMSKAKEPGADCLS